jgi:hypothetical protein
VVEEEVVEEEEEEEEGKEAEREGTTRTLEGAVYEGEVGREKRWEAAVGSNSLPNLFK